MAESIDHTGVKIFPAILSLFIPGLGQVAQRLIQRGVSIFALVSSALVVTLWYGDPYWLIAPCLLWVWNLWDAFRKPTGAPVVIAALLWFGMAFGIGTRVTEINFGAIFENPERAESIWRPMLNPDFLQERSEKKIASVRVELPCGGISSPAEQVTDGITVAVDSNCVFVKDSITLKANGLWENYPVRVSWRIPLGNASNVWNLVTDAEGSVIFTFEVPPQALAQAPDITLPQPHDIEVYQSRPIGGVEISQNGLYVIQGIYETLALALLATTIGAVLAVPFGFLAAHNLMSGNVITRFIYYLTRTVLNIFRSIESLIFAIIFVRIVGLGPFPGMIAITLHTIAALGKLYSEVIEGIDPGPIEAIRSTGANWLEVIRYAVIPQIVPPFTALTIFRWDINVRSSTIIGFVGGGGIGFFLYQWILLGDYRAIGTSFIAIAVVVTIMDFFSARVRERLI